MNASGASNPELRGAFPWLSANGAPCGIAPWVAACLPSPAPAPNAGPDALLGPAPAELIADASIASACPLLARPGAVMYSSGRTNQARGFVAVRFLAGYASEACAPECVFEVRCQQKYSLVTDSCADCRGFRLRVSCAGLQRSRCACCCKSLPSNPQIRDTVFH